MRIAFYAPLKSPDHLVPSGDRQMARMLMRALEGAGHRVDLASTLRGFSPDPEAGGLAALRAEANAEIERLAVSWTAGGRPDLWFCYHPYYKAPDLIGPALCQRFAIPYVTAEASYSARRNIGPWAETQAACAAALGQAALNLCFTRRDFDGIAAVVPHARLAMLPPFIDTAPFAALEPAGDGQRLMTVAMMRKGDKSDSYRMLAQALRKITSMPWSLSVIGGGPCRVDIEAEFAGFEAGRIAWLGERRPDEVAALLASGGLYLWPGCGEAYGLAYLEAQAAGLPVMAQHTAGVPEVVRDGVTGILTPDGDVDAYAAAIARLLTDEAERRTMAVAARRFVLDERSLSHASALLARLLPKGTADAG